MKRTKTDLTILYILAVVIVIVSVAPFLWV